MHLCSAAPRGRWRGSMSISLTMFVMSGAPRLPIDRWGVVFGALEQRQLGVIVDRMQLGSGTEP